ncbi:hypothetical protein [Jiella marina]|uniref:hypothetical protein n=1 Tax=Jiella sp. LLJ827 TaxID=2917712 RepID=UPI0021017372|nr:hypothetical protein [Jiella sp. LLJ827]MCQ0987589.1 hypothetical protein [Jiella sp. LLJ827]
MKKTILATTMLAFTAAPAFAQSDNNTDAATNETATNQSSSQSSMSTEDMVASQNKVLSALKSAGYSDAAIMDAAYLVSATTPDGERVIMMIDTQGRVMGASSQNGAAAAGSGDAANSGNSDMSGSNNSNMSGSDDSDMEDSDMDDSESSAQ